MIINIIVNSLFLLLTIAIYKKHPRLFFFFVPFIIQYVWMTFSITTIESGIYITEQKREGYFQYANLFLLLFFLLTFLSFSTAFYFAINNLKISVPKVSFFGAPNYKLLKALAIIVLTIAFTNLIFSNNIFNDPNKGKWPDAITKFNYWEQSAFPALKTILGNTIGYLPFMLGILFGFYRKTTIFLLLAYLTYLIGIGQKFGPILNAFTAFMMPFFVFQLSQSSIKRYVKPKIVLLIGALLFSIIYIKYSIENPYDHLGYSVFESIFQRAFGLQAHLFWGVVDRYVVSPDLMISWNLSDLNYGMHKLMTVFWESPLSWLDSTIERGVSWTNAYPAILLTILPWPLAYIAHTVFFALVGFIAGITFNLISEKKFLWAVLLFQIYLWTIFCYTMAYFYRIYFVIGILLMISLISHVFQTNKQAHK